MVLKPAAKRLQKTSVMLLLNSAVKVEQVVGELGVTTLLAPPYTMEEGNTTPKYILGGTCLWCSFPPPLPPNVFNYIAH